MTNKPKAAVSLTAELRLAPKDRTCKISNSNIKHGYKRLQRMVWRGGAIVNLIWVLGFLTFSRFNYTGLKFGASTR